jgi:hypothetical protein
MGLSGKVLVGFDARKGQAQYGNYDFHSGLSGSRDYCSSSELPRVLLRPAFNHDLLFRIELNRIAALAVHDSEE